MITHRRHLDCNVIFELKERVTAFDVHALLFTCEQAYEEIGDAMGIVIDRQQATEIDFRAQVAAQHNLRKIANYAPIAIVGELEPVARLIVETFLSTRRKSIMATHDTIEDALVWLEDWYFERGINRAEAFGQKKRKDPNLKGVED